MAARRSSTRSNERSAREHSRRRPATRTSGGFAWDPSRGRTRDLQTPVCSSRVAVLPEMPGGIVRRAAGGSIFRWTPPSRADQLDPRFFLARFDLAAVLDRLVRRVPQVADERVVADPQSAGSSPLV